MSPHRNNPKSLDSIGLPLIRGSRDKRQVLARLTIALVQLVSVSVLRSRNFGSRADDVMLCCAIYVGQADGCPMKAGKIAEYSGLPRATVVRKIAALADECIVSVDKSGRVTLVAQPEMLRKSHIARREQIVHMAARELSKMDTI